MKKHASYKLGKPFNDCFEGDNLENDIFQETLTKSSRYRQTVCYQLCKLRHLEEACQCSLPYQLGLNDNDTCKIKCLYKQNEMFIPKDTCGSCPLECNSILFDKIVNLLDFSQMNMEPEIANYSVDFLIYFRINFDELIYTSIREVEKMTLTDLIGNIGGIFGNE